MPGAEDPSGAVLELEHGESGASHGAACEIQQPAPGASVALDQRQPKAVIAPELGRERREAGRHRGALAREVVAQRGNRGVPAADVLRREPAGHLATDAEGERAQRQQRREGEGDEEPRAEAHGAAPAVSPASAGRTAASHSTTSAGPPRRSNAYGRVSTSGTTAARGGHAADSRHGTIACRGRPTT